MLENAEQYSFSVDSSNRFKILEQPIHPVSSQPQGIALGEKHFDSDSFETECQMPLLTIDISRQEFQKEACFSDVGQDFVWNTTVAALRIHAKNSSVKGLAVLTGEGKDDGTAIIKVFRNQSSEETSMDRTQLSLTRFDLLEFNIFTEWIDMQNRLFEDIEKELREHASNTHDQTLVGVFKFID